MSIIIDKLYSSIPNGIVGRKRGITTSERLLRAAFADALSKAIGSGRGAQSRAAERLGISRQAVSLYLNQKATAGPDILRRACDIWKFALSIEGTTVDASSIAAHLDPRLEPIQISLFRALTLVEGRQLKVEVLKKSAYGLDLRVSIDFEKKARGQ